MKKLLQWLKNSNSTTKVQESGLKISKNEIEKLKAVSEICHHHSNELYPGVKALEHCEDCNTKMCYMCGSKHLMLGHNVKCTSLLFYLKGQSISGICIQRLSKLMIILLIYLIEVIVGNSILITCNVLVVKLTNIN